MPPQVPLGAFQHCRSQSCPRRHLDTVTSKHHRFTRSELQQDVRQSFVRHQQVRSAAQHPPRHTMRLEIRRNFRQAAVGLYVNDIGRAADFQGSLLTQGFARKPCCTESRQLLGYFGLAC